MHFSGSQVLVFIVLYVSHHWQFVGVFVVLQKPLWSAVVLRCKYCSMSFLDFIKGLYFFPSWLCNFKELFIPVWREIRRSKILPVTSWQFTKRTVTDISHRSRHSTCQLFSPCEFITKRDSNHSGETKSHWSRRRDFVARSVAGDLMHCISLRSL